ncbi:hypothetical protein [Streptomyces gibsoniae]|uniref:Uncharacterized protein n=1 Tax=Streptomyces gibsoniae TaxID=3075529 RepID=A0ABU2U4Q1_9ACTN|nr:hypothetical protein [Streptomyces sp. DSM 41699]MDT0468203.1 hypothetical protein [Streptomyces sp. DSM 41699]
MPTRTFGVTAAVVATGVLATAGLTYASAVDSTEAAPHAKHAAHAAPPAAKPARPRHPAPAAPAAATANGGGDSHGKRDEGDSDRGRDHDRDHDHDHDHDRDDRGPGWIHFNERTYSAAVEGCVTAASGLGSNSFSIDNDSDKFVEVYRGFTCDNGSPVATVGPHGSTFGVVPSTSEGGDYSHEDEFFRAAMLAEDNVAGSFRVVHREDMW